MARTAYCSSWSGGSWSAIFFWICIGVHLLVLLLDRAGLVSQRQVLAQLGFSYAGVVRGWGLHRFLTAAFLHGNFSHLIFNLLCLWMLGRSVEGLMGGGRYLLFSALCAVSGFLGYLLCHWGSGGGVTGYSGIVFGLLVAQAIYFPNNRLNFFGRFPMPVKFAVLLLGAIELYLTISPDEGGVANAALLFGGLGALLYFGIVRWSARRPGHAGEGVTAGAVAPPEEPDPDWGEAGRKIAAALEETACGQFAAAGQSLDAVEIPRPLRSVVSDIRQLIGLSERADTDASDSASHKIDQKIEDIWKQAMREKLYVALPPLVDTGLRHGDGIVAILLDKLTCPEVVRIPPAIREQLEKGLAETGSRGLELLLTRLADATADPDLAQRFRVLLPAMNLQKQAPCFMTLFAQASATRQACWVDYLARMKDNSAGPLLDLIAGVLNRMPPDLRLAAAIQTKIGAQELEKVASRWAAGQHRGAQTVLIRLYRYPASAFT